MLNDWEGIGRFKEKPELKETANGIKVCTVVLAVQRDVSKQAERDQVDWIPCVFWAKHAEIITTWYDKGDPIFVSGRLQNRYWEDIKGQTRAVLEVHVKSWYRLPKTRDKSPDVEAEPTAGSVPSRPTSNRTAQFTELPDDGELPF